MPVNIWIQVAKNLADTDHDELRAIVNQEMPFGRFKGRKLIDLPEPYVVWFRNKGYPKGRLGMLLATLFEIKANGLEGLLAPLRDPSDPRFDATPVTSFREGD